MSNQVNPCASPRPIVPRCHSEAIRRGSLKNLSFALGAEAFSAAPGFSPTHVSILAPQAYSAASRDDLSKVNPRESQSAALNPADNRPIYHPRSFLATRTTAFLPLPAPGVAVPRYFSNGEFVLRAESPSPTSWRTTSAAFHGCTLATQTYFNPRSSGSRVYESTFIPLYLYLYSRPVAYICEFAMVDLSKCALQKNSEEVKEPNRRS
jgi:hypothetical protein